jgi:hypothetical protein
MKRAADEGRLRMYAVDLLKAASDRLTRAGEPHLQGPPSSEEGGGEVHDTRTHFEAFLGDLIGYLDGDDYLIGFLRDGLRRAEALARRADELARDRSVETLDERIADLEATRQEAARRRQSLERLRAHEWESSFEALRDELDGRVRERTRELAARTVRAIDEALDAWFRSDASLQELIDEDVVPIVSSCKRELAQTVSDGLRREATTPSAGAQLAQATLEDLLIAGVRLEELSDAALRRVGGVVRSPDPRPPLAPADIPVHKGFGDWMLFRGRDKVRERLFGPPEAPTERIPADVKQKRLGDEAREAMRAKIVDHAEAFVAETGKRARTTVVESYVEAICEALRPRLSEESGSVTGELDELERRLGGCREVRATLERLERSAASARAELERLGARYEVAEIEREHLLQPEPRREEAPAAPAPPEPAPMSREPAPGPRAFPSHEEP